ncbi:putative hexokinase-3 [Capsicum annuum]|nr:putative hexokinase-3 [Capsicum annuum]
MIVSRDVHFSEEEKWDWKNNQVSVKALEEQTSILWQNELGDDPSVRGTRLLFDIYQQSNVAVCEPVRHDKALQDAKWRNAMEQEMLMIKKNNTWEVVDRPKDRQVIGVKWVFRIKLNSDGFINKYKARLVVKGYPQIFGVDYSDTFAPVAHLDIIRMIDDHLLSLGFVRSLSEVTLYVKHKGTDLLIVSLYVDDLLATGNNVWLVEEFKKEIMQVFEITDLGLMTYFLGMEIKQGCNEMFICQKKYAREILKKFHMENCKAISTPMNPKEKLSKEDGTDKVDEGNFRSLIGCLMYLTATRPDILFVVSLLSRFMHCATEMHLQAAKRIIRYIKVMAAELVRTAKVESKGELERLRFYYYTAGTGGAGPTILATSFLLLGEDVVAYNKGEKIKLTPYSGMLNIDFGLGIGKKDVYLLNLPEVKSVHEVLGVPTVSARFGTDPFFWNWGMIAMRTLLPQEFLRDRSKVQQLVQLFDPVVRAVDGTAGEAVSMRVDLECSDGHNRIGIFSHKGLSRSVGISTAAFVLAILEGSTKPGVWFPEEPEGIAVEAREVLLQRASQGTINFIINKFEHELKLPS